jgi:hypothetical protein
MKVEQYIERLNSGRLSESLQIEFKECLNIDTDAGKTTLVKAVFALRNYNGGGIVYWCQ